MGLTRLGNARVASLLFSSFVFVTIGLDSGITRADEVNVECYGNGDGTVSCQRLSDGKWFTCSMSVGGTSTCWSPDGEPITCTRTGGGISSCSSKSARRSGSEAQPGTSVFGF